MTAQVTERRAGKPHFVLTGGRMPTPPSWASGRIEAAHRSGLVTKLTAARVVWWHQKYRSQLDIIAVRWLP